MRNTIRRSVMLVTILLLPLLVLVAQETSALLQVPRGIGFHAFRHANATLMSSFFRSIRRSRAAWALRPLLFSWRGIQKPSITHALELPPASQNAMWRLSVD
jgi:hypothetical protein